MTKDIVLTFAKADGKSHNMTVADYKEGITDAEIKTGGEAVVTAAIFEPGGYGLTGLVGAKKVDKTTTDVAVK